MVLGVLDWHQFLFPLNFLRTNCWILTKFCICINIDNTIIGLAGIKTNRGPVAHGPLILEEHAYIHVPNVEYSVLTRPVSKREGSVGRRFFFFFHRNILFCFLKRENEFQNMRKDIKTN